MPNIINPFLTDKSLETFIAKTSLSREKKDILLAKVSALNEEGRLKLLHFLKEIYLLDLEEKKALETLKKRWQNK